MVDVKLTSEEFEAVFERVVSQCRAVLIDKAREYATDDDRTHNFKNAAALIGCTPKQALWGFAVKHLVSVSDMVASDKTYTQQQWDEKIGDSINYLILLQGLIASDTKAIEDSTSRASVDMSQSYSHDAVTYIDNSHPMTGFIDKTSLHTSWCKKCRACVCHDMDKLGLKCKGSNL